jgi:hypothetical protein
MSPAMKSVMTRGKDTHTHNCTTARTLRATAAKEKNTSDDTIENSKEID